MGIKDLLPQLKQITREVNISELRGKRVGVDAYVWLHQKAYGCATTMYIDAFVR